MSNAEEILREPWAHLARQRRAGTFGIWVFLASEALFFGALLLTYTVYRVENPLPFAEAGRETNIYFGSANTAILLTSSLTMAIASQVSEREWRARRLVWICLAATAALGVAFLVVKGFEYREDLHEHLFPGPDFRPEEPAARIFFAMYWILTGVHAIHLTIGLALVGRLAWLIARRDFPYRGHPRVEVTALYWHLIDIVWIFLFPLIYLPGRAI